MKKIIFLFAIFICNFIFSQVSLSGNKLVKDGQPYKFSEYKEVLTNAEAQTLFKKARTNRTIGNIFAGVGGAFMGFGLARIISTPSEYTVYGTSTTIKNNKSPFWTAIGIGAVVTGLGIPFAVLAKKNTEKAIAIENGESSNAFQPYFQLESAGNGISLSYNF